MAYRRMLWFAQVMINKADGFGGQVLLPGLYAHLQQCLVERLAAFYPTVEAAYGVACVAGFGEVLEGKVGF